MYSDPKCPTNYDTDTARLELNQRKEVSDLVVDETKKESGGLFSECNFHAFSACFLQCFLHGSVQTSKCTIEAEHTSMTSPCSNILFSRDFSSLWNFLRFIIEELVRRRSHSSKASLSLEDE